MKRPTLTQRLTKTVTQALRLDQLAKTFQFTAHGCCPVCRLVQPVVSEGCVSGCDAVPRQIAVGDEEFFEPLKASLQVIPEDPNKLRKVRVGVGMVGYFGALALLLAVLPAYYGVAILGASAVPLTVAMAPRLKRPPPTTSSRLSAARVHPELPAPVGDFSIGIVANVEKTVRTFLTGDSCVACEVVGVNARGKTVVRARRASTFQLKSETGPVVVRGALQLVGEPSAVNQELSNKAQTQLGIKQADLVGVEWRETILLAGSYVRVHGTPKLDNVQELAAYRDEFANVVEAKHSVLVEIMRQEKDA